MSKRTGLPGLTVKQAADRVGVHVMTMRRYLAQGKVRGYRVGEVIIRIHEDSLDDLITPVGGAA